MKVVSVNTAIAEELQIGKKTVKTGINKRPQKGPITVTMLGLKSDTIVNKTVHGGPGQAVYLYSAADYEWWSTQLGHELKPGTFGENLTISDFHADTLKIGDRLVIGNQVTLEISAPRVPCSKLSTKMGDSLFAKKFVAAERPGAYARVIAEGEVEAGANIEWVPTEQDYASINEVFVEWHRKNWSEAVARKALFSPISEIARDLIEKRSGIVV